MLLLLFFMNITNAISQITFKGTVSDIDNNDPIGFANVWIKHNNSTGCITQLNGSFEIIVPRPTDTIMITAIGYKDYSILGKNITNTPVEIKLAPAVYQLEALVVTPGKNPAIPIVKSAIDNRRANHPNKIKTIDFIEYNKLNLNISNLDSAIYNSNFVKKNPDVLIKINEYDETWSVPLYFSERLTYEKRQENAANESVEIVQNQHGSSFINSDVTTKYIASLNTDMTFYGNLRFLMKDFISPISAQAFLYYKYYLKDSLELDNSMFYKIDFRPKNSQDLAFYGHMIIEKGTGQLTEIDATLQPTANLNYVKRIRLSEKLQKLDTDKWFYRNHKMQVEFTPQLSQDTSNNLLNTPLFAIKSTTYITDSAQIEDYKKNKTVPARFNLQRKTIQLAAENDTNLLNKYRPDTLSSLDLLTKQAIEVTNNIPAIKTANKILDVLLYGYYQAGILNIGPYLYFIQANEIEKIRFNFAATTSPVFSKNMIIGGYLGYGLGDKKFKYGALYSIKLPTQKYGALHFTYDQNIYRIGDFKQNLNYVRENVLVQSDDNLLAAISTRVPNKAVYFVKKTKIALEQQIHANLLIKPHYNYSEHYSPPYFPFDSIRHINSFRLHEVGINFRFSFKEEMSNNHFRKIYIDSRYPVFHLNFTEGMYEFADTRAWYSQVRFVAKQNILVGIGRLRYVAEAGLTYKPVPFPLLEYHRGNETGSSGEYYFNQMKYLEFASARFVQLFTEYGMNGYFFNKIWLLQKLHLRELLTFKICWGQLSNSHASIFPLPGESYSFSAPYMEAGVGITNFLKVIRIEYIWRLNYMQHTDVRRGGLYFRFQFEF